ncbi:MAG: patatin-like phospholipase family protein [Firmicutes bacterium]|nr:patatin-like phospholipase family protein [Bacillota bacterium]
MKKRKTALVLSGGGSRGGYQCGVWQALEELGIDIDIVVGVSVGAINGSMVVQGDSIKTANLWREMETDMIFDVEEELTLPDVAKEMVRNQGVGSTGLQKLLHAYVDEEFIRQSPVDFGLEVVEIPSFKPHFLWKEDIPEGQLADFITASASVFPAIHAHRIGDKLYADGGYEDVCPAFMALEKGATDVIAVYLSALGRYRPERLEQIPNLTMIKSKWDLGDVLSFDKTRSKRLIRLGWLDTMKTFDIFDGEYYTFVKGAFDKRTLKRADAAARVFGLDPLILYGRETFLEKLAATVRDARSDMEALAGIDLSSGDLTMAKLGTLLKKVNKKTATVFIADHIRAKGEESIFLKKYAGKILKEETDAAKFLAAAELV